MNYKSLPNRVFQIIQSDLFDRTVKIPRTNKPLCTGGNRVDYRTYDQPNFVIHLNLPSSEFPYNVEMGRERSWGQLNDYLTQQYGLTQEECDRVWDEYRGTICKNAKLPFVNESIKHTVGDPYNFNWCSDPRKRKFYATVLKDLVNNTIIDSQGVILIGRDGEAEKKGLAYHNISHPYNISPLQKYLRDTYGLLDEETPTIWSRWEDIMKDKMVEWLTAKGIKLTDAGYEEPSLNESVDLSYSDDKDFPFLNKLANHTMSITEIERNAVLFPFIEGYISDGNFYKYFHGTPYDQLPLQAIDKLDEYLRDFGLTENEKEIWWDIYVIKVMEAVGRRDLRIIDSHGELYESTNTTNYLDRIMDHLMGETTIDYEEKVIKFNFFKYLTAKGKMKFGGLPFTHFTGNDLPRKYPPQGFMSHCRNIYGLTKSEVLEVWALYYDRIGEEIKSLPPLNESTEDIYEKIANSIANESKIIISPAPYNKMFLRSPAWKEAQHIENVIDQLNGRIKDVVPELFIKHLKEIYNIRYTTFVQKLWELYRERIIDKIEKAHQTSNESTEDNILDRIAYSMYKESISTPDRFPFDGTTITFDDYVRNMYGLSEREATYVYEKFRYLKGWHLARNPRLPDPLNESKEEKSKQAQQRQIPPKQRKFFDYIVKTLVDETEVNSTRHVHDEGRERIWVTPPFLNHAYNFGTDPVQREDVEYNYLSYFGYGYARYMKDIYGLTDQEGLKLWAPYYKALQKKVDELIERDRIIYGDD